MKKCISLGFAFLLLALCAGQARAEIRVYNGTDPAMLRAVGGVPTTLAPTDPFLETPGNDISVTGGTVAGHAYGGYSETAGTDISGNSLTISGGTVSSNAFGGASNFSGNVYSNSVTISNSRVLQTVYGGFGLAGDVFSNSVTLNSGGRGRDVYGGSTMSGNAYSNTVTIDGGTANWNVFGGYSMMNGDAYLNTVTIINGSVGRVVRSGHSDNGNAYSNTVTISGGTISQQVYGGYSGLLNARDNTVNISGSATVVGHVYGGSSFDNAYSNTVNISGAATLSGNVYAGDSHADATGNTVTVSGAPNLTASTLYGGFTVGGVGFDVFTGNSFLADGVRGLQVVGLQNFQNYSFYLPNDMAGQKMIVVSGAATDMNNTNVRITGMQSGGTPLQTGQHVILIDKVSGAPATTSASQIPYGISMLYDFNILVDGANQLVATVANVTETARANPRVKALSEGFLGGFVFNLQGSDLIVGQGMRMAGAAPLVPGTNWSAYFTGNAGYSTYHTGSHVNVGGFSLLAGMAWRPPSEYGKFFIGPFFEAGWGSYDSYNSFANAANVNGKGNTEYYGGGLLARYDLPCGAYFEASGRIGGLRTEFNSSDLRDPVSNRRAEYDLDSTYYGAHAGLGYVWTLNESAKLDIYTKYLWTHQTGQSVRVADDHVDFKDADSHRVRGGARFTYAVTEYMQPYAGAAWEWEFDGRARASVYGYKISPPDVTGGTGMGELGLTLKPFANREGALNGVSFDLAAQGYVGVREGLSGTFQAKWEF